MAFSTPEQLIAEAVDLENESASVVQHLEWFEDELTRRSMQNESKHLANVARRCRALAAIRSENDPAFWGSGAEVLALRNWMTAR
jgi:hypothetical protein